MGLLQNGSNGRILHGILALVGAVTALHAMLLSAFGGSEVAPTLLLAYGLPPMAAMLLVIGFVEAIRRVLR